MPRYCGAEEGNAQFFPFNHEELRYSGGIHPIHHQYVCGACGIPTNGRVVCAMVREGKSAEILWCVCACAQCEPAILIYDAANEMLTQLPIAKEFKSRGAWPVDLASLYDEAATAYGAGAFTACAMVCRKLLMVTACNKGETDGKRFVEYVQFITDKILQFPDAKAPITKIKDIGNDANHDASLVNKADAERAMKIVTYMLDMIYSLPAA
jgi:hypothetical protein